MANLQRQPSLASTLPTNLPMNFMKAITSDFSTERELGRSVFGTVYKGVLPEGGRMIAVKRLAENAPVPTGITFATEVTNLMALKHQNIVELVHYCHESWKKVVWHNGRYVIVDVIESCLCYRYLPKGSLDNYLYETTSLNWDTRFKIVKGICQGLHFLHKELVDGPLIHMNLVPNSIWLDDNWVPKIADSGLSRLFGKEQTRMYTVNVKGHNGYIAPEYLYRREISTMSDIYSLGMIILEITTRERNYSASEDRSARQFVDNIHQNWKTDEQIMYKYPSLDPNGLQQVKACVVIGLKCVEADRNKRPSIEDIVNKLNGKRVPIFDQHQQQLARMEVTSGKASLSEVEEAEEASPPPVEDRVFVAVPKDIKNGKRTLLWALENPAKDCTRVVIAHVHCPAQMIPMMGRKVHHSVIHPKRLEDYRKMERAEAHKKLDEYVLLCRRQKVSCEKIIIEMDDVARGLEELISLHGITKLVVGTRYSRKTKSLISKTALRLAEVGVSSCKIWFTCNGHLICTREANTTVPVFAPPPAFTVASKSSARYSELKRKSQLYESYDRPRRTSVSSIDSLYEFGRRSQYSWQDVSRNDDAVTISGSALPHQMQEPDNENFSSPSHEMVNQVIDDILESLKDEAMSHLREDECSRKSLLASVNQADEESTKRQRAGRDKFSLHKVTMNPSGGTMETPVSSSLGAMGPLLRKVGLLLTPKYPLRSSVKDAIQLLKEDLEDINDALVVQSMMDSQNHRVKYWMHEARELSYHIEDVIDTMMLPHTAADGKAQSVHGHKVARLKIHRLPNILKPSARIARIAELRTLLWEASERYERYQLDGCASSSRPVFSGRSLRIPVACHVAGDLVGIDGPRNELTTWLTDQAEQQLKIKCVVGPAGVGKTALAKQLYRELRCQFECRAFIRVPRKPHMSRLLWAMLSQIQRPNKQNLDAFSVQSLIHNIRKHLQNKRYFIVMDGLWEAQVWDIMNSAFPKGHNCSRIMITCEVNSVAMELCSYQSVNVLELKPLGSQDCEKLFFDRISVFDTQCPDQLKEACRILTESGGLPLATLTFAGLLASQLDNSDLWYHLHQYFISNLANISSDDMLKGIVNFCYNSLPQYLKTCLLYITMYPEGCTIRKVDLVRQWIAEGFISATTEGKERVAESYFDELVNRGMIQPEKIIHGDEVLSCTVHHIVFDLLMHKSREENFITAVDYSQTTTEFCMKAHRLSLHFSRAQYAEKPKVLRMSQVRSLAFFGLIRCMPSAMEFKVLRVLILELWADCIGRRSLNLSRISKLFHLRYLKISSQNIFVKLQPPMQGLKLLETLEIDARVSEIDISCLPGLLHLSLQDGTKLPDGIDRIISLQTLQYLDLGKNSEDNIRSLGELINLRDLHITCSTALSDENLKRKLVILASSLGRLANLKSVTLDPGAIGKTMFVDHPVAMFSTPSILLQRLELLPPICIFSRLPEWIGELKTLRILKIVVGVLLTSDIDILTGLPDLTVLSLFIRQPNLGSVVFSSGALPVLKYFKYTCGTLRLAFEEEALPNLQRLKLCFNICGAEHSSHMISGIERVSNLKEIAVNIGAAAGAKEYILRAAESWFKGAIHKHPRLHVCLNVKNVGRIEEESRPSGFVHGIIYCLGVLVLVVVVHMLFWY